MPRIIQSVGKKGKNDPFDTAVVQKLLAVAATLLGKTSFIPSNYDGRIDDSTIKAIETFQRDVLRATKPDGRIDPGGATFRKLVQAAGEVDVNPDGWPARPAGVTQLTASARDGIFSTFVITDPSHTNYPGYEDTTSTDPDAKDDIVIKGGWVGRNIHEVTIPQLAKIVVPAAPKKYFHKRAIPQLLGLWQAWDDAGLLDRIRTFDGAYNARYMRNGPHIQSRLSNHAWGTAFDINERTNKLGQTPAVSWEAGCVFDLVPLAVRWGFYWGGWFGGGRVDGMHFEVRTLTHEELAI